MERNEVRLLISLDWLHSECASSRPPRRESNIVFERFLGRNPTPSTVDLSPNRRHTRRLLLPRKPNAEISRFNRLEFQNVITSNKFSSTYKTSDLLVFSTDVVRCPCIGLVEAKFFVVFWDLARTSRRYSISSGILNQYWLCGGGTPRRRRRKICIAISETPSSVGRPFNRSAATLLRTDCSATLRNW